MAERFICVDLGGTTTRVAVCDDTAVVGEVIRFPTKQTGREAHLDRVAAVVQSLRRDNNIVQVGLAVGATIDADGVIRNASMLWSEAGTGFDLIAAMRRRLPWARISACNDIAAAAWRYEGLGRFALVTVSTGVAVKVFDASLPLRHRLILDEEQLGGEVGHVLVDVSGVPREKPWCECGNVGDLCSYTSGPAAVRMAAILARADAEAWHASKLAVLCDGSLESLNTAAIASAAQAGDGFTLELLRCITRPLASHVLQTSALLGLRHFVVMGGFANGVGQPWFAALRANLRALLPQGGWFTGWSPSNLDNLVRPSLDGDDSLVGMAHYLAAQRDRVKQLDKPVGATHVELRDVEPVPCGREQFAVRIDYAGICGTDLQILRGERGCEPGVLGHECVGRVVETGPDVHGLETGTVIGVNPNHPNDEHDKLGHNQPGVFRQRAVWDAHLLERGQVVPLPGSQSRPEWVLLEPLACAVRSIRLAPRNGTILVIGAGVSGLLHVLLGRRFGAERVLLANRSQARLRAAVARGLLPASDCLTLDEIPSLRGIDAAIVTVSGGDGPSIVDSLWPVLADGATVHLFGGFPPDAAVRLPDGESVAAFPIRCGTPRETALPSGGTCRLVGSRGFTTEEHRLAVELASTGLDLAPLISHVVSLDAAPGALAELAANGTLGGEVPMRAVIDLALPGHVIRELP